MPVNPTRPELELYSYQYLATLWGKDVRTLQNWVSLARKAGMIIYGTYRLDAHHRRREFYIRGDSVLALQRRFFGIVPTVRKPRKPRR